MTVEFSSVFDAFSRNMSTFRIILILAAMMFAATAAHAQPDDLFPPAFATAPEISGGKGWLNTSRPLTLSGLRGKVVLLDFWTYGCINCIHVIPDLKKLEAKYPKSLVVIGVHSAKFENEGEIENIRNIVLRYGVEHPVVNDADFRIWNRYGVNAWPTRILIDAEGRIIARFSGEGDFETIDRMIREATEVARARGRLDETPLALALERNKFGNLPLSFPGKILADARSNRLFISDSGHNRIVVTDLDGKLIETIGSGVAGAADGDFRAGTFNQPQGLALGGDFLYVADRENHKIRRVDLKTRRVETIAGTGNIDDFTNEAGRGLSTGLRSPWDLALDGVNLYIAMAGSHQIWRLNLASDLIEPYAGNRWEEKSDGPRLDASFAQPSGLAIAGGSLYVADSESNIIRRIDLKRETVETLVGGDLFEFGDKDGIGDKVRLQHPLGVLAFEDQILIADTYNHRIKSLDPVRRSVSTVIGTGRSGQTDGRLAAFYEPGGLSAANGRIYVADTNNHAIRVFDPLKREVSTLRIAGLKPPREVEPPQTSPNREVIRAAPVEFAPTGTVALLIDIGFPDAIHLNPNAPHRVEYSIEGGDRPESTIARFSALPVRIPIRTPRRESRLTVRATFTYCRTDNTGVCRIKTVEWIVPLVPSPQKMEATVELRANIGQ